MAHCVFCNGEIPAGAPPEHVIGKWMSKFRPKGAVVVYTWRQGISVLLVTQAERRAA